MFKIIKNKKLRKFIIISLILIVVCFILSIILNIIKSNYRKIYKLGEELVYEETYNVIFNEIDIKTIMSDIDIKHSSDNDIKVIVYGEEDYINLKEKNNKLFIDIKEKNFIAFDFYRYISKIEIYLPEYYSNLIRINSEYGNINLDSFNNLTLYVDQKLGNFKSGKLSFIKIENKKGNIDIEEAPKIRIDSEYSNIKIEKVTDLEINNKGGNIEIESINEYLKINNESGNIKINSIVLEKDSAIENKYGDIDINNIKGVEINAKTAHGEKKIKNNDKKALVSLKIYNGNGDIKVN